MGPVYSYDEAWDEQMLSSLRCILTQWEVRIFDWNMELMMLITDLIRREFQAIFPTKIYRCSWILTCSPMLLTGACWYESELLSTLQADFLENWLFGFKVQNKLSSIGYQGRIILKMWARFCFKGWLSL